MITTALIVIMALVAIFAIGWAIVAVIRREDGRAMALGVIALGCYAVVQLLRSVQL